MVMIEVEPLEYVDIKRGLESLKMIIEEQSVQLQINKLTLEMMEEHILQYPKPDLDKEPSV
jgi:hypothetical protein